MSINGFATTTTVAYSTCSWCGWMHTGKCSLVKAIEHHPNGAVKRVEFYEPASPVIQRLPDADASPPRGLTIGQAPR